MDFLKKGQEMLNQQGGDQQQQQQQQQQQGGADPNAQQANAGQQGSAGQEDYGDKGLDFLEKKTGHTMGRDTNEKITDGARGMLEKATGKNFDSKWSN